MEEVVIKELLFIKYKNIRSNASIIIDTGKLIKL